MPLSNEDNLRLNVLMAQDLKAVRIDDTHGPAYLQLGVLYRLQGEADKAIKVLERAHSLDDAGEIGKKAIDILRQINRDAE